MVGASLVVQLLNNLLAMQETLSWVRKISWRRDRLSIPVFLGFPGDSDGKKICLQCGRPGFDLWVGKREDLLEEAWQPPPLFLPGESPWTEEADGLQSLGSQRVGND